MIDALLLAVRQAITAKDAPFKYGVQACEIRDDGQPPPRCGDWFVSIHQLAEQSFGINRLDEYFSYAVTLTGRVTAPLDRIGDAMLAKQLAGKIGFNRRMRQLKLFLHQNWDVIGIANNILVDLNADAEIVYGFCEAGRADMTEPPALVGPDWFGAAPPTQASEKDMGIKAQTSFVEIRRLQPIGTYT